MTTTPTTKEEARATMPGWLQSVLSDDHLPQALKDRLSSLTPWSHQNTAAAMGIGRERLWSLRNSESPTPHPSRFPVPSGETIPEGLAWLWGMQSHRTRWNYSRCQWTPARTRHGGPRTITTRVPRRAATEPVAPQVDPARLRKLATERERRRTERRKTVGAAKHPKALQELLLDPQIWTIRDMAAASNIGVARLGLRRTTGRRAVHKTGQLDWFALDPDTIEGFLPGSRENIGVEAGRARQWAMANGLLRWDDKLETLVATAEALPILPLAQWEHSSWYQAVIGDENMPADMKARLTDLTGWDLQRSSDELDISVAYSLGADSSVRFWYPDGDIVPAGWVLFRALQTRRVKWSTNARVFAPSTPRHGRPVQSTGPRRRRTAGKKVKGAKA